MPMNWYVVHTYAGFENKVRASLLETVTKLSLQDKIGQVLVPTEEVLSLKGGKKRKSQRKFFPGYILVEMDLDDNTWHVVKDTPKVTGFVGGSTNPTPLSEEEVKHILKQAEEGVPEGRPGTGDRRTVQQLHRNRRGREPVTRQAHGDGEHLRKIDAR